MKTLAAVLSMLMAAPLMAQPAQDSTPEISISTTPSSVFAPLIITAPWLTPAQVKRLKETRAGGTLAAASGLGVIIYSAVVAAAGPIAWASALLLVGGLTAYLSQRRLKGHKDFSSAPQASTPQAAQQAPVAAPQKLSVPGRF